MTSSTGSVGPAGGANPSVESPSVQKPVDVKTQDVALPTFSPGSTTDESRKTAGKGRKRKISQKAPTTESRKTATKGRKRKIPQEALTTQIGASSGDSSGQASVQGTPSSFPPLKQRALESQGAPTAPPKEDEEKKEEIEEEEWTGEKAPSEKKRAESVTSAPLPQEPQSLPANKLAQVTLVIGGIRIAGTILAMNPVTAPLGIGMTAVTEILIHSTAIVAEAGVLIDITQKYARGQLTLRDACSAALPAIATVAVSSLSGVAPGGLITVAAEGGGVISLLNAFRKGRTIFGNLPTLVGAGAYFAMRKSSDESKKTGESSPSQKGPT